MRVYQKGYWAVYSSWNSLSLIQDSISAIGLLVCSFILANRVITGQMYVILHLLVLPSYHELTLLFATI